MDIPEKLGINETDFRLVFGYSKIDYDLEKDESNRKKHGYSLESAVYILQNWLLPIQSHPFITSDPIIKGDEIRHQHIGVDDENNVVFIVTTMRTDETVRVISFRRASKEERQIFADHSGYNNAN
ncbi:BrnT family toxin [Methylotuvimicrobium sp.]|uniref:BrnT family toxin n=1 Tax=Methylotuvimicrobium sp. TaxID=2822413 RepID=UPI003D6551BC